ncbi:hypothetical protein K490DRAFT_56029 [Saccharata proteae CBS 121410]|uniref:Uncharacterized protein n=1 Tax=Saccharata proteae CBS 121410 TaxID=1314787 RepID=A0A9P4M001_9PEZI|nr:hypothetical protein K490DRAFT_56029 [Saccharata proteae CBS 121410]
MDIQYYELSVSPDPTVSTLLRLGAMSCKRFKESGAAAPVESPAHHATTEPDDEDVVNTMDILYRALGLPKDSWITPSTGYCVAVAKEHAPSGLDWRALVSPAHRPSTPTAATMFRASASWRASSTRRQPKAPVATAGSHSVLLLSKPKFLARAGLEQ